MKLTNNLQPTTYNEYMKKQANKTLNFVVGCPTRGFPFS
jgi:hypothetical protein